MHKNYVDGVCMCVCVWSLEISTEILTIADVGKLCGAGQWKRKAVKASKDYPGHTHTVMPYFCFTDFWETPLETLSHQQKGTHKHTHSAK